MSVLSAVKNNNNNNNNQTENAVCMLLWFFPGVRVVLSEILMLGELDHNIECEPERRPDRRM